MKRFQNYCTRSTLVGVGLGLALCLGSFEGRALAEESDDEPTAGEAAKAAVEPKSEEKAEASDESASSDEGKSEEAKSDEGKSEETKSGETVKVGETHHSEVMLAIELKGTTLEPAGGGDADDDGGGDDEGGDDDE